MQRTIVIAATLVVVLSGSTTDCRADWLNYLVRPSGLGWSDGYHADDQCPPRGHGHFPVRLPHMFPACGVHEGRSMPYYFEEPAHKATAPAEPLPPRPADVDPRMPDPQARFPVQSRYFQTLRAEQQGALPAQSPTLQARRPESRPPF